MTSQTVIEVWVDQTGDNAEASTVEDAVGAAITLTDEAVAARRTRGFNPTVTFKMNGLPLYGFAAVPQRSLWQMGRVAR